MESARALIAAAGGTVSTEVGTDERHFQTCVACRARSPEAQTNYTLISSRFGWRLHRYKNAAGDFVLEWYCPKCWAKRKAER